MDHKELDVWKKSMDLVEVVYSVTANFPKEERYGLASQMQRAAVSIPSNIAEGTARKSNKELLQFISIAMGSAAELETQYLISIRLGYNTEENKIMTLIIDVKKLLLGFRNYIKGKS
jgi:four helix bundle protein